MVSTQNIIQDKDSHKEIQMRAPDPQDGAEVYRLIERCPPLDCNSIYCNLLQTSHHSATSVTAWLGDYLVGFVSAYLVPERSDTLFIWQVAVDPKARGQRLGKAMINHLLSREACAHITAIETTITESNTASWSMFKRLAESLGSDTKVSTMFDKNIHFQGSHDTEYLVHIPLRKPSH